MSTASALISIANHVTGVGVNNAANLEDVRHVDAHLDVDVMKPWSVTATPAFSALGFLSLGVQSQQTLRRVYSIIQFMPTYLNVLCKN